MNNYSKLSNESTDVFEDSILANEIHTGSEISSPKTKSSTQTHSISEWSDDEIFEELDIHSVCSGKNSIENRSQSKTPTFEDENVFSSLAEKAILSNSPDVVMKKLKLKKEHENLFKKNEGNWIPDDSFWNCSNLEFGKKNDGNQSFFEKSSPDFYGLPEKIKFLIQKYKGIDELYEWQDECLKLDAVKNRKNLIYALPTSGGKTLVAELLMLREILNSKKNTVFILPFVALVQEKIQSFAPFALELDFLVEEYAAGKGQYPPKKRRRKNSVYICTIEKALGLINSLIENGRIDEIGLVVVDELHLLGESNGRGATLESLLTKIMYVNEKTHIVGMSATIGNLNEIARFLKAELYTQNFRPIEIKEYIKCGDEIFTVDLRTEEIFVDQKRVNYKYSKKNEELDPDKIGGLVMDVFPKDSCLIFCSSRKNCENVALLLSRILPRWLEDHKKEEKDRLVNFLKAEGELCSILEKTLRLGVAYHHSGLTSEERKLLEDAFKNGTLGVICCTSTLAAGVNLPARRVILRTPYIANQLITMSRYKQMIGRAGRAGMGSIGESILIVNPKDLEKVQTLLSSRMEDSLSSLHIEVNRGLNNLILSSILLSIASTRSDVYKLVSRTLMSIQEEKLGISVKSIVDNAIITLLESEIIKVKSKKIAEDVDYVNASQCNLEDVTKTQKRAKLVVNVARDTELELCELGRAAMKGCIDLPTARKLYHDLETAQKNLNLRNHLHLLYLITPYDYLNQIKPVGSVYYEVVMGLPSEEMDVARLIGINEGLMCDINQGPCVSKDVDQRVINRFYITLILYELWCQDSIYKVARKYEVNRGIVQNLLSSAASFTSSVVRFCEQFPQFWAFKELLTTFGQKIMYCCAAELEPLMELPSVKIGRARQLYKAGYKTLQLIAKATPSEMHSKIEHLPMNTVIQIIATANLLIVEKVENLRDEADEFLDGIDLKLF